MDKHEKSKRIQYLLDLVVGGKVQPKQRIELESLLVGPLKSKKKVETFISTPEYDAEIARDEHITEKVRKEEGLLVVGRHKIRAI